MRPTEHAHQPRCGAGEAPGSTFTACDTRPCPSLLELRAGRPTLPRAVRLWASESVLQVAGSPAEARQPGAAGLAERPVLTLALPGPPDPLQGGHYDSSGPAADGGQVHTSGGLPSLRGALHLSPGVPSHPVIIHSPRLCSLRKRILPPPAGLRLSAFLPPADLPPAWQGFRGVQSRPSHTGQGNLEGGGRWCAGGVGGQPRRGA